MHIAAANEALSLDRGSIVVCIFIGTADSQASATVRSVMEHSPASTQIVLAGSPAALERLAEDLDGEASGRAIRGLALAQGVSVHALNAAIQISFPGDVILLAPGIHVMADWSARLQAAACSDSTIASATPFSLGLGGLELSSDGPFGDSDRSVSRATDQASVAYQQGPVDTIDSAARRICESAGTLRPRIATIGPGCVYIRRAALELAGPLDESKDLSEALANLAKRMTSFGMVHVVADDVLVGGSLGPEGSLRGSMTSSDPVENDVQAVIANDERGQLRRVVNSARTALERLSVTIDGRALNATVGGTQTYLIELILALARGGGVAVRVLTPPDLSDRAKDALASVPDVELLTYEQALDGPAMTDVVHRPQQVFTPEDLTLLRMVGERIVIGQQDLVAFHNYAYHRDGDAWRAYRRTTRLALAAADQVIFFSEHARRDALTEDLLPIDRTHVVGIGAEAIEQSSSPGSQPPGLSSDRPFLLCLGADYAHKNRPFAIRLVGALRELGWDGQLVLAGTHVPHGSSQEDEQQLLRSVPELADHTVDLGAVDEATKKWLYAHAGALLYPTIYEGFGLLPVEAARAGLPCLFASQASLSELAGGASTLVPWDASASATAVLPLLSNGSARSAHLAVLRALPIPSWAEVAEGLVAVYRHALASPSSGSAPRIWQELERENYIVRLDQDITNLKRLAQEYQDAYHSLEERVHTGLPLIDDGGLLTPAQQRGLMRIAGRGRLGALAVAPLGLIGRRSKADGSDR
jgi:glycosyltransferase involved in cell wall biosynthesis